MMNKIKFYLIIIIGWPIAGLLYGILVATITAEHGSVVFVFYGAMTGAIGGFVHALYFWVTNKFNKIRETDPLYISALVLLFSSPIMIDLIRALGDPKSRVIIFMSLPVLVFSYFIAEILKKAGRPRPNQRFNTDGAP